MTYGMLTIMLTTSFEQIIGSNMKKHHMSVLLFVAVGRSPSQYLTIRDLLMIRRDYAKTVTSAACDEALKRLETYRIWFHENILRSGKGHALLVLPIESTGPRYRDEFMEYDSLVSSKATADQSSVLFEVIQGSAVSC